MYTKLGSAAIGTLMLATPLLALAADTTTSATSDQISQLQQQIISLTKILNDLSAKRGASAIGIRMVSSGTASPIATFRWSIHKASVADGATDNGKQIISANLTLKDKSKARYKVGEAYGCTESNTLPSLPDRNVIGIVQCSSGTTFTAYWQNGSFFVARGDGSTKNVSVKNTIVFTQ